MELWCLPIAEIEIGEMGLQWGNYWSKIERSNYYSIVTSKDIMWYSRYKSYAVRILCNFTRGNEKKNCLISDFAVRCKGIGIDGKLVDQDANLYRLTEWRCVTHTYLLSTPIYTGGKIMNLIIQVCIT